MPGFPDRTPRVPGIESFGTVLTCMDGRPQRKVADYLIVSLGVRHLDTITTAGTIKHLVADTEQTDVLLNNAEISMNAHGSRHLAVVAHHDCAGNPVSDKTQREQVAAAVKRLSEMYPDIEVVGLWLNDKWIVERVRA